MISNPDPANTEAPACMLCAKPVSVAEALVVEMNRDAKGEFHARQDHINHAERVTGIAHLACYRDWYETAYGSPFTMTGDGT